MSLYNDLVRNDLGHDTNQDELKAIQNRAEGAASDLLLGVSSIGSLMFWAASNDNYAEGTAKDDMYNIGAMLGTIGEVTRALSDTAASAAFLYSISKKEAKGGAGK